MPEFNNWSTSALSTLQACGEKFRRRHIEKEFLPSGINAVRGSSFHSVAAEVHKHQMAVRGAWAGDAPLVKEQPGSGRAREEARDLAASSFVKAMRRGVSFTKEQLATGVQGVIAAAKDAAVDMAGFYVTDVAPKVWPIAVERKIEVRPADMDISVKGYVDLVVAGSEAPSTLEEKLQASIADLGDTLAGALLRRQIQPFTPPERSISLGDDPPEVSQGEALVDLKTSERSPQGGQADASQQLTMYAMLRQLDAGKLPEVVRLDTVVRTPALKKMKLVRDESTRNQEDVVALVQRINVAVDAVQKGVFVPANPDWWGCSQTYCEFFESCKFTRGRRRG